MRITRRQLLALCGAFAVAAAAIFIPIHRALLASEAEVLALQLSWDAVGGNCIGTALVVFPDGPAATRLMRIGTPATSALLRVLDDPVRGVAAHLVLTHLYHPDRTGLWTEYHRDESRLDPIWGGPAITGWTHILNGLRWQWHSDGDRHSVDPADLQQNSKRWHNELKNRSA